MRSMPLSDGRGETDKLRVPIAGLTAMGGSDSVGRVLPQCKDGSPRSIVRMREGVSRLREPNAGDDWSVRQDAEVPRRAS